VPGWKARRMNLADVLPGMMIGGDGFENAEGKLPDVPGRAWYEADIGYIAGPRNAERVVYSNDGLVFVTVDHFFTFYSLH